MRAYFPNPPSEEAAEQLRQAISSNCELFTSERPADYEILIEGRATPDQLSSSLRTIIIPFAGVPDATLKLLRENPHIRAYNLHHNASDTAEVAVALLFAAAKLIVPMDRRLRNNDWGSRYEDSRAIALEGKTALVLGYGQIGKRIARMLSAVGMRVVALRRSEVRAYEGGIDIRPSSELHEQLPSANALIVALPQTSETKGLLREKELSLLPNDSVLVNIARGPIIDEEALYNSLRNGRLHSAGLDVWYQYPQATSTPDVTSDTPPSRFPFGDLDNVVLSPHRAGTSMDTEPKRARDLANLIKAIVLGQDAPNKVDIAAGY